MKLLGFNLGMTDPDAEDDEVEDEVEDEDDSGNESAGDDSDGGVKGSNKIFKDGDYEMHKPSGLSYHSGY